MQEKSGFNRIIDKLIAGGRLTPGLLKSHYRKLCKATHPDLNRESSEDFLHLQEEYKEAREFLKQFQRDYLPVKKNSFSKALNPRLEFYNALHYYTISGLHAVRVRNKKELKSRNLKIIKDVIFWAKWYDKSFIPIFLDYNKPFLRPLAHRETEKRVNKGRQFFRNGLDWFFKFELAGMTAARRTATSFLADAVGEFASLNSKFYKQALLQFALWVQQELKLEPVCRKNAIRKPSPEPH